MARYKLDFYRKKDNSGIPFPEPLYFRPQFIKAKNIKEVTDIIHIIGNYGIASHDSDFNYESDEELVKVSKFNKLTNKFQ